MNKKILAMKLGRLEEVANKKIGLEQYQTDSELASEILWEAFMMGDVEGKVICDFGCGNGIFGVGALMLGAKKVYFVEKDKGSLDVAKRNAIGFKNVQFFCCDVSKFNKKFDVVIMNPPFGVQKRKADKIFLEKAFELGKAVYSIHKTESKNFIEKISSENGFKVEEVVGLKFLLKKSYEFHRKRKYFVDAGLWVMRRKTNKS